MSEAFLRCPAEVTLVSGGGDGGVGKVQSEVGPVVEDSAAVNGFDDVAPVVDALFAGAGAGEAAGALLQASFLPDKEGACNGSGRTPVPPLPAPRGLCRGATEVAEDSADEDGWWWWWGSGEPATLTGVEGRAERGLGGSRAAAGEGEEEGKDDKDGTESWCRFCTGHFFAPFSLKAKLAT